MSKLIKTTVCACGQNHAQIKGVAGTRKPKHVRVEGACGLRYSQMATDAFDTQEEAERFGFRILFELGDTWPHMRRVERIKAGKQ